MADRGLLSFDNIGALSSLAEQDERTLEFTLGAREIVARFLSRYILATALHERYGFRLSDTQPLKRVELPDGFRFEPCDAGRSTDGTRPNVLTLSVQDHQR